MKRQRNALQIDRSRHDKSALHIAIEIIDDANLLHVGREIIIDGVKTFLEANRRRDHRRKNNGADSQSYRYFNESEAVEFCGGFDFHFLVPFEIMHVTCSLGSRG